VTVWRSGAFLAIFCLIVFKPAWGGRRTPVRLV